MQVAGKVDVTGSPGDQGKAPRNHHGRHDGQAVETVGQVDRVGGANDDKVGQHDKHQAKLRHHILEERHHQLGLALMGCSRIEEHRHRQRYRGLPEILPARDQAVGVLAHHLEVVVGKADGTVGTQHKQHQPDIGVVEAAPEQHRRKNRSNDHQATHGRGTPLAEVGLGTIVADHLTKLQDLQATYQAWPHPEGNPQSGDDRQDGAKRQVGEDVEEGEVRGEQFGQPD